MNVGSGFSGKILFSNSFLKFWNKNIRFVENIIQKKLRTVENVN